MEARTCRNCSRKKDQNCIQTICIPDGHSDWEPLKVYISGPITGVDNYQENFQKAADELKAKGFDPVNPCDGEPEGFTWEQYMRHDLKKMMDCDVILLLVGWQKSRGARIEANLAAELGLKFIYDGNLQII